MMAKKIDNLDDEIAKEGITVVDFTATWCGPCKVISPILHNLEDNGLIKVVSVDVDLNKGLAMNFGIQAVPYLVFYKNGDRVHNNIELEGYEVMKDGVIIGALNEKYLRQIISQL